MIYSIDNYKQVAAELLQGLNAAYKQVNFSMLGGTPALYLNISLDPRETWGNGIYQNSRYIQFSIEANGHVEVISRDYHLPRFRTRTIKDLNTIIKTLNNYFVETSNTTKQNPTTKKKLTYSQWLKQQGVKPSRKPDAYGYTIPRSGPVDWTQHRQKQNPTHKKDDWTRRYTKFHGKNPDTKTRLDIGDPRKLVFLGLPHEISYVSDKQPFHKPTAYLHKFGKTTRMFTDRTGKMLIILGTKFKVTDWLRG